MPAPRLRVCRPACPWLRNKKPHCCAPLPPNALQLEVLDRLSNVLLGQQMLPQQLGAAIAKHAAQALGG